MLRKNRCLPFEALVRAGIRFGLAFSFAAVAGWAQEPPPAVSPTPLGESRALELRIEALERSLASCEAGCSTLSLLVSELREYQAELIAARQAELLLEREQAEAEVERQAASSEPGELSADEVQRLSPSDIEVLEQGVRLTSLDLDARKEAIEKELLELSDLRRRQTELIAKLSSLGDARAASPEEKGWQEERRQALRKARDLAGRGITTAMDGLELARRRLAVTELLLERRSSRLSSLRLFEGIPAEEIARSRERVEQLRQAVTQRAGELEEQLGQVERGLDETQARSSAVEAEAAALEPYRPRDPGALQDRWKRRLADLQETLEELRSRQSALSAARDLIRESVRLDEFLLALQDARLEEDNEFNRLLGLIRSERPDVVAIEQGLARMRDQLEGVRAEREALEITQEKIRKENLLVSEQIKHTALRLEAATEEAARAEPPDDALFSRASRIEATLSHQQAISESLSGRRSLIEEALSAAAEHLKKQQDSVHLLESYAGGALRFNQNTLLQALDWARAGGHQLRSKLDQLPGAWLELRLSLREPRWRSHVLSEAASLFGMSLALLGLDLLLGRVLSRRASALERERQKLEAERKKEGWLLTGFQAAGPPKEKEPMPRHRAIRMVLHCIERLRRPVLAIGWCAMAVGLAPELRGLWVGLGLGFLVWLARRGGVLGMSLLCSQDERVPSWRLWPESSRALLLWSKGLFTFLPPLAALYGGAQISGAPIPVRLTLGLFFLAFALLFLLLLLLWGRRPVIRLIRIQSAREKPSFPILAYNYLVGQVYLLALLTCILAVGLAGAGYGATAQWLAVGFGTTVGIFVLLALVVRGVHHWLRRVQAHDSIWGDFLGFLVHLLEALLVLGALVGVLVVWGVDLGFLIELARGQMEREVFQTADGVSVKVVTLAWVLVLLVATIWVSRRIRELLQNRVYPYLSIDRGQQLSMNLVIHYGILTVAGFIGLNMLGVNLTTLRVVLGAIGLGVGFGLQTIVNNFASGLIILFERSIRPDDVIDFGGTRVKVEEIRARCTVVTDEDNKPWIVPNVRLVSETITNWTRNWGRVRYISPLFMSPRTDVRRLQTVVNAFLRGRSDVLQDPPPDLRLLEIQQGSLRFGVYFCTTDAWPVSGPRSRILIELVELLQREGFELAVAESRVFYKPEA